MAAADYRTLEGVREASEAPQQQTMKSHSPPPGVMDMLSVDLSSPWLPEDEILEEFEFDHELTWRFHSKLALAHLSLCFFNPLAWPMCYFIPRNEADKAYCRWVAVSRDHIIIVRRKHKAGCRCECQDVGATRKVIPIANVQDVMITEPAGTAFCCCIWNVLTDVQVQTAAAHTQPNIGGDAPHRDASMAVLRGLKDPQRFRRTILSLKTRRYSGPDAGSATSGLPQQSDALGSPLAHDHSGEMVELLRSIDAKLAGDLAGILRGVDAKLQVVADKCVAGAVSQSR